MDKFELLKKYKELYEQGIIEKDEFDSKKKELLAMPDELASDKSSGFVSRTQQSEEKSNAENVVEGYVFKKEDSNQSEGQPEVIKEAKIAEPELTEEEKEEQRKELVYNTAKEKLEFKTVEKHREAIGELESLGGWGDSVQIIEKAKTEFTELEDLERQKQIKLEEEKQRKKKKTRKILKIVGIIIGAIVILFIALMVIATALTPDISEYNKLKEDAVHDMTYSIPASWESTDSDNNDVSNMYIKKDDGKSIAVLDVTYKGENDLTGDAEYDDSHTASDRAMQILPDCAGTYARVKCQHSEFEVTVYAVEGEVKGENELLDVVTESFEKDSYINPRESIGIDVSYDGSTKAGVTIDSSCEDITVTETFDTGVAEGEKTPDWTVKTPVTLKEGETSTVTLVVGDIEKKLKVTCTDMSESQYKAKCKSMNYKNQLRKDSYGEYIKISGKVLQDCGDGYFRISSNGSYDDVYMVLAKNSDIVEDDSVTCYGITSGIYTYETVMGAEQKIPSMIAKYVDR